MQSYCISEYPLCYNPIFGPWNALPANLTVRRLIQLKCTVHCQVLQVSKQTNVIA